MRAQSQEVCDMSTT